MWLRAVLDKADASKTSFDEENIKRFQPEIDICLANDYNEKGKVNTDFAVFKYDFTYYMTEDERKKFPEDKLPEPLVPA